MAYELVEEKEMHSPRQLERKNAVLGKDGTPNHYPSVGGKAYAKHRIWRCSFCRALAVTDSSSPPDGKCGRCHR